MQKTFQTAFCIALKGSLMLSGKGVNPEFQEKANLVKKLNDLINSLSQMDPQDIHRRVGVEISRDSGNLVFFKLPFFNQLLTVNYPEFHIYDAISGKPLGLFQKVLIMHYLSHSDGFPLSGNWIAFSELPSGNFYAQAYEGYTGKQLLNYFGNNSDNFANACEIIGGYQDSLGQYSYAFDVLPNVRLLAACWLGDEDFPTSYKILFDRSIVHHMTTDGCAILGSMLAQKIISKARSLE